MEELWEGAAAAGAPTARLAQTEDASDVKEMGDVDMDSAPLPLAPRSVVEFPTLVPMENEFKGDRYYVRECYPEYYGLVMDMLSTRRGVAITGTPGIGKSVFMAYFFKRYSTDHPTATIELASYDKDSVLKKVVTTFGGKRIKESRLSVNDTMEVVYQPTEAAHKKAFASRTADSLWLLDGPPKTIPVDVTWVSFTSPNEKWLGKLRKSGHAHHKLFMPTWTLEELRDAANELERKDLEQEASDDHLHLLEIDAGTEPTPRRPLIDVYFDVFGGVPRSCFAEGDLLLNEFEWLRSAIRNLTLEQVWKASNEQGAPDENSKLVHRVIHYEPEEEVPVVLGYVLPYQRARLRAGSIWIKRWLFEREEDITKGHQDMLMNMLRAAPQAHSFLGFLYEAKVYQRLGIGCTIEAVRVGAQSQDNSTLEVSISKTCSVGGIINNFTTTAFDRTRSHLGIPFSKNLESIDGFYWHPNGETFRVVLFQVTVAKRHPVKAGGLIKVFKELNLWEAVQEDPQRAALVFVVPKDHVKHFIGTPQKVPAGNRADDTSAVETLSDVGKVRGGLLASCEIITVGQLRQCKTFADITKKPAEQEIIKAKSAFSIAKKSLEKYESEGCNGSDVEELLQSIPQYVWGL